MTNCNSVESRRTLPRQCCEFEFCPVSLCRNPERTLHGHDNRVIDYAFEREFCLQVQVLQFCSAQVTCELTRADTLKQSALCHPWCKDASRPLGVGLSSLFWWGGATKSEVTG